MWLLTDAGLAARIAIGASIFAVLALSDVYRNGRSARRWREYSFLLVTTAIFMAYGALNDAITCRISWEYFYYGKDLAAVLGPHTPPAIGPLTLEAAKIGMRATWSAGLIVGVALLLANNPRPNRPQLPFRRLLMLVPGVLLAVVACGVAMGVLGFHGHLVWMNQEFRMLLHDGLFRPPRFMSVFGIHLGAYLGGALGTVWAVRKILRERKAWIRTI
ncbi:MAG: hypothetical protein JWP03_2014 [Phycisphaerales bacterium]|nr:hypothetical protein [Phycisphaerales bacterium]